MSISNGLSPQGDTVVKKGSKAVNLGTMPTVPKSTSWQKSMQIDEQWGCLTYYMRDANNDTYRGTEGMTPDHGFVQKVAGDKTFFILVTS